MSLDKRLMLYFKQLFFTFLTVHMCKKTTKQTNHEKSAKHNCGGHLNSWEINGLLARQTGLGPKGFKHFHIREP